MAWGNNQGSCFRQWAMQAGRAVTLLRCHSCRQWASAGVVCPFCHVGPVVWWGAQRWFGQLAHKIPHPGSSHRVLETAEVVSCHGVARAAVWECAQQSSHAMVVLLCLVIGFVGKAQLQFSSVCSIMGGLVLVWQEDGGARLGAVSVGGGNNGVRDVLGLGWHGSGLAWATDSGLARAAGQWLNLCQQLVHCILPSQGQQAAWTGES